MPTDPSFSTSTAPIGIFDSGFGGLTVMRAIRNLLPHENILYFGDTAHLPYGNKSPETILRYSLENTSFLMNLGIKLLVIACHTACSAALNQIQHTLHIPVIGVVLPAVEQTIQKTKTQKIAVLGTRGTIASGIYQSELQKRLPHAEIAAIACPLFVPLVEEGFIQHPLTEMTVREYLHSLHDRQIDTLLLGCTHYPLLHTAIQNEMGACVFLVDPAMSCAETVRDLLIQQHLKNAEQKIPEYKFYASDGPEQFRTLGKAFLNYPIEHVSSVHL
jgi:glutamate racemase